VAGYLSRVRARDGSRAHGKTVETLHLPLPSSAGYVFLRRADMEKLELRALAAFLFVGARPTGQHVYGRELCERFDWSQSTANKWVGQLVSAGLVARIQRQTADGRWDGHVYALTENRAARPIEEPAPTRSTATIDRNDFNSSAPSHLVDHDAAGQVKSQLGGISSWLLSPESGYGAAARMWRKALRDAIGDDRLAYMPSKMLHDDLCAATAHKIGPTLLSPEGLDGYRLLVCALCNIEGYEVRHAHEHLLAMLANQIGADPAARIHSWVYLIKSTFRYVDGLPAPGPIRLRA
jgi:hypothetical protein